MADESWIPEFRCCWCDAQFVRDRIDLKTVWICPTEECRERQLSWRMDDEEGHLFYLPNPRQVVLEEAVASRQFAAICIGGARGGSKSIAWRRIAQRYCRKLPNFTVLFLRRELEPLELNHLRFIHGESKALGATFASMTQKFPATDSQIRFSHCHKPDDYRRYVGAEADLIVFEQLEQFEQIQFVEIGAAAGRTDREDWRGLVGASENPNGPSSEFVDTIFVKKDMDKAKFPNYDPTQYLFIFSQLSDNPWVSKQYVHSLSLMDSEKRDMYRLGRRDVYPGKFFKQFNPTMHVVAL